ncbi:MAG: homoserine kinase [Actinomycetes bacterium]
MAAAMNRLTFRATMAQVSVPASSANLGPGFDSLCLALDIRDRYAAQILDEAIFDVDITGEGADEIKRDAKNLVIKSMMHGFEFMGSKPRGLALRALNAIPQGRGLGSSASAIVGGLALARALVLSGEQYMSDEDLVALGTELEGHPDNIAAAFYGGATIAWMEESHGKNFGRGVSLTVDPRIKAILFLPETHLATTKARKLLPELVPHRDAAANVARSALLVHALTDRPDLLFAATQDFLHQEYRGEAMPKSLALIRKLRAAGVAATVSGAGPAVLVLHIGSELEAAEIMKSAPDSFAALTVNISPTGVQ